MRLTLTHLKPFAFALLFLLLFFSVMPSANAQRSDGILGTITGIKAYTIDMGEGKLRYSDDVLEGKQGSAPVFVGSGAANYPEHHLMIVVEVTGGNPKIELKATEGRKLILRQVHDAYGSTYDREPMPDKYYAIFYIEGMRCEVLKLTARSIGAAKPSSLTKTLEFGCGE